MPVIFSHAIIYNQGQVLAPVPAWTQQLLPPLSATYSESASSCLHKKAIRLKPLSVMSGKHLLLPEGKQLYDSLKSLPHITTLTPAEVREIWQSVAEPIPPQLSVSKVWDEILPWHGEPTSLKIYQPHGAGPFPILLYLHGGGFVGGNLVTHASKAAAFASIVQATVVAVDYPLAPEHPYPAAVDACWAAVEWAESHADHLKGDPSKVIVAGESAGGNLSIVMSLVAQEKGRDDLIKAVIAACPSVDAADLTRPSYIEFEHDEFEDKACIEWFHNHWFRGSGGDPRDPHISPMYAPRLAGLPPTFILTAEVDVLRDEAEDFARKLEEAGVTVKCKRYNGHYHNSMLDVPRFGKVAEDVYHEIKNFTNSMLAA